MEKLAETGGLIRSAGGSTQIAVDNGIWNGTDTLSPPYPPKDLSVIYEKNTIARKSIDTYALNIFGAGYTLKTYSGDTESEQLKQANEFLLNINPEKSFEEIIQAWTVDFKNVGYAGFEIARNSLSGLPDKIFDIPIATLRVGRGGKGKGFKTGQRFLQIEDNYEAKVWYNKYYSKKEDRTLENGYDPNLNGEGIRTNEIMWFTSPNPASKYYGLSPSITLLKTYLLAEYCQCFNIDNFESGMLQKFAILLNKGAKLTDESVEGLRAFLQENNSKQKWSTIPILKANGENGEVKIEKLMGDIIESSFIETLKFTREEVYIAFGVPPVLLGIMENSTQANQEAQRQKFYENECRPIEKMIESRFNKMFKDDFGWNDVYIEANQPDFGDKKIESDIAKDQMDRGVITINEWRNMSDKDAIDGGDEPFIKTPYGIILVKDIPTLTAELFAEGQSEKMAKAITSSLLNFKAQKEEQLRAAKILAGTEESDDPYIKD